MFYGRAFSLAIYALINLPTCLLVSQKDSLASSVLSQNEQPEGGTPRSQNRHRFGRLHDPDTSTSNVQRQSHNDVTSTGEQENRRTGEGRRLLERPF